MAGPGLKATIVSHGRELSPQSLLHFGSVTPYQVVTKRKRQALSAPAAAAAIEDLESRCLFPASRAEAELPFTPTSAATTRGDRSISVASTPPDLLTADYGDGAIPTTPVHLTVGTSGGTAGSSCVPLESRAPSPSRAAVIAVPEMGSLESAVQPAGGATSHAGLSEEAHMLSDYQAWSSDVASCDVALFSGLCHLQTMRPATTCLPPVEATAMLQGLRSGMGSQLPPLDPAGAATLLPFLHEAHWSLLAFKRTDTGSLQASLLDGIPGRSIPIARTLTEACGAAWQTPCSHFREITWWLQTDSSSCGALVLAHAAAFLAGTPAEIFLQRAHRFLSGFKATAGSLLGFGGLSSEQEATFKAILVEHGVPPEAVDSRALAAIQKVGPGAIAQALLQKNKWQALKAAGSKPGCLFKYVQLEELQAHIQRRAQDRHGLTISSPKAKKQKASKKPKGLSQLQVDPTQLRLVPGSFVAKDGTTLKQLSYAEVQSQASGVCFCLPSQAFPFLQDDRNISIDPLALVVTSEVPSNLASPARVQTVRFPAMYTPTSEAVLLVGSLVQLGDEEVQLFPADSLEVEGIETITCRLNVYRDESPIPWDQLAAAPIRTLLQQVPGLKVCRDNACTHGCGCFHPSLEEDTDQVFLDVWARQFSTLSGVKAAPSEAQVFQAYVRVPASAPGHLFKLPNEGIYFDPRDESGTGSHRSWSVVWIPGADKIQARHAQRTCDRVLGLARLGLKFGVRTKESDEQHVFNLLRPHHEYSKVRVLFRYRAHPLPFGTQRSAVAQLIRGWGWAAKPLQPDRGDGAGSAWLIGSAEEPSSLALPVGKGFVLLTKLKEQPRKSYDTAICASSRTLKHLLHDDDDQPTAMPDPWCNGQDPWAKARASADVAMRAEPSVTSTASTKLSQIEGELRQDLEQMVQRQVQAAASHPPPGLSAQEQRLQQLEVGVTELQQQGRKFEHWFQSVGSQVQDQAQAITALQSTVQEQQKELGLFRTEVQTTVTQAVGSVQTEMARQLSSQLQGQMEQIQALFSEKKMRH